MLLKFFYVVIDKNRNRQLLVLARKVVGKTSSSRQPTLFQRGGLL